MQREGQGRGQGRGHACIAFIASSNPGSGIRSMATAGTRATLVRHESVLGRVAHWNADAPRVRSSSMARGGGQVEVLMTGASKYGKEDSPI